MKFRRLIGCDHDTCYLITRSKECERDGDRMGQILVFLGSHFSICQNYPALRISLLNQKTLLWVS